jgi:MFS family permease
MVLLIGKLFDTFDIKWLNIGSVLFFEIGSAICGAVPTSDTVIVGRVIAGIGGSGMYKGHILLQLYRSVIITSLPLTHCFDSALNYLSIFVPKRQLPLYNASIGLCWGAGAIIGPAIGGVISDSSASWGWAFYINLPLATRKLLETGLYYIRRLIL